MRPAGRRSAAILLLAGPLLLAGAPARAQADEQALVDRATLTINEMLGDPNFKDAVDLLRRARAILVIPRKFRAGFIVGGEGGGGVLLARDGSGSWTSPAFFGVGGGSVGLQIGVQDAQVLMLIMNDRALNAILNSQFKFGADASLAVATIGAGIAGGTTTALGADLVTVSKTRGLFAGAVLEGTVMSSRSEWNQAYYGRDVSARQIVVDAAAHNPAADGLRAALMRFSQPA